MKPFDKLIKFATSDVEKYSMTIFEKDNKKIYQFKVYIKHKNEPITFDLIDLDYVKTVLSMSSGFISSIYVIYHNGTADEIKTDYRQIIELL